MKFYCKQFKRDIYGTILALNKSIKYNIVSKKKNTTTTCNCYRIARRPFSFFFSY